MFLILIISVTKTFKIKITFLVTNIHMITIKIDICLIIKKKNYVRP